MQGTVPCCGLALSETVGLNLAAADSTLPGNWHALLPNLEVVHEIHKKYLPELGEVESARLGGHLLPEPFIDLHKIELLTPIVLPSKIIAVGLNYRDHAEEQNKELPQNPMLFSKASTCLQMTGGPIELPVGHEQIDAEAELAVIIGQPGKNISTQDAAKHIAGYTCFNDVSDREAQRKDRQYFRAKSMDTGGPCGPWIVTPDELPEFAQGLNITCHWNDQLMQSSNTNQLIFPVDELISYISRTISLMPGDIISTGTPGGVGVFRDPKVFLKAGDTITVEIEGIGVLSNPVVDAIDD
ncbi:MAG: fumarylacetoacetate hydrolase family protein [bacterium]|nr:fumarylacetoacetate hydrolase family protein [bacterium]